MSTRDNFSPATKETLAKRVGWRCSNPDCRKLTIGPHEEATKSVNIGVAAHITAAASGIGAKRYDPNLSTEERKAIPNGIWLCQNCGKLVDSDEQKYSVELLVNWKREAEDRAASEVENVTPQFASNRSLQLMSYLQNLVDSPRICWLDEFVDLTGREFDLFTKVQKKSENPGTEEPNKLLTPLSTAIHDSDQRSILITGDPGAGKSTFLENLSIEAAREALTDPHAPIPVLVHLKDYDGEFSGIRGLVYSTLESYVNTEVVAQLLSDKKILLLIDGWNELSDEKAKSKIKKFCQSHTVIVTSRSAGDYWEIQQKFEIQPLSQTDVKKFFDKQLQNIERQRLQELLDRVRDFGQTPLIVWMLLIVFRDDNRIPKTRGEAYRCFTATYEKKAKGCADFDSSRKLLGKLAFEMMKSQDSEDSTEFRLNVSEVEAEEILGVEEFNRMLNHLLKQQGKMGIREISFCHQSIQEYYAAEHLRRELDLHPEWLERQDGDDYSWLQYHYLNYTKWTESIALMLGVPEINQQRAITIVEQALNVDLMLGARLAGEVRSDLQEKTVGLVRQKSEENQIPYWLRMQLFPKIEPSSKQLEKRTKVTSLNENDVDICISELSEILENECSRRIYLNSIKFFIAVDRKTCISTLIRVSKTSSKPPEVRFNALSGIEYYRFREAIPDLIPLINDKEEIVRFKTIQILGRFSALDAVPELLRFLAKSDNSDLHHEAIMALGNIACKDAVQPLISILNSNNNDHLYHLVIEALGNIKSEDAVGTLIDILTESKDHDLECYCIEALGKIGSCYAICILEKLLNEEIDLIKSKSDRYFSDSESEYKFSYSPVAQVVESNRLNMKWTLIIALGRIGSCEVLPLLKQSFKIFSFSTIVSKEAYFAIHEIQSKCKFYDYEIEQQAEKLRKADRPSLEGGGGDRTPTTIINQFPNASEVKIFENVQTYHESLPRDPPN